MAKQVGRFLISQQNTQPKPETNKRTTSSKNTLGSSETKKRTTPKNTSGVIITKKGRFTVIKDVTPVNQGTGQKTQKNSHPESKKSTTKTITVSKKELSDLVCSMQNFIKRNKLTCE
jgi:hypothetical protein